MKISVFGNQDLKTDNIAWKLLPYLRSKFPEHDFIHQDPQEECQPLGSKEWWIIDTVKGLDKVSLIDDIEQIKKQPNVTMHDYDLATEIKLIKKINPDLKIRIIGVPDKGEISQSAKNVADILLKIQNI